jgi:hypothetical protein
LIKLFFAPLPQKSIKTHMDKGFGRTPISGMYIITPIWKLRVPENQWTSLLLKILLTSLAEIS